jgi:hypothetical protein
MTRQEHHDKAEELASEAEHLVSVARTATDHIEDTPHPDGSAIIAMARHERLLRNAQLITALAQIHATLSAGSI